ncbi:hypothetical protein EVAR_3093_1 [Eumeta japonica]|uniref:Uncharacterized protein n=1 Tax=Eumeta variegata TaxID=151549 RepID=A0A4C1SWJ9_EUMVA|nr:hypothetical protein EVAR_3093_1 [Eumeta japonica]
MSHSRASKHANSSGRRYSSSPQRRILIENVDIYSFAARVMSVFDCYRAHQNFSHSPRAALVSPEIRIGKKYAPEKNNAGHKVKEQRRRAMCGVLAQRPPLERSPLAPPRGRGP